MRPMTTETTQISPDVVQVKIVPIIAKELSVGAHQVAAAITLLDEGATVPFIARYRKEATGNLDIKGANVSAKATSALQLEGTSTGSLKSSGILEVKGSLVNIN